MAKIPVEDRIELKELVDLYCYYADMKQFDKWVLLFTEDCIFDETSIGVELLNGRKQIAEWTKGPAIGAVECFIHYITNHIITGYAGDTAKGISYTLCCGKVGGSDMSIYGYYDDEYTRVDGAWLISKRTLSQMVPASIKSSNGVVSYSGGVKHFA